MILLLRMRRSCPEGMPLAKTVEPQGSGGSAKGTPWRNPSSSARRLTYVSLLPLCFIVTYYKASLPAHTIMAIAIVLTSD